AEGDSHLMADAPLLTRELMDLFNGAYLQGTSLKSASITPFYSDLQGLPPVLLHVGGWELLRDDAITMAARLQDANVTTELKVWDGMVHCWQLFAPMLDEATQSLNEVGRFVAKHLSN
ncbi:MAG: alpha/beta hydrolase fold domain-containing protein, partial [Burkholderiaceae bacterium]